MILRNILRILKISTAALVVSVSNLCGFGQDMNIETLKKQLHELQSHNTQILGKYDSLIRIQSQLKSFLENELKIYQACETAYMDKLHFLEQGGDFYQKRIMDEFNILQLEHDGLESRIVLNIRDFNYWNELSAVEVKTYYEVYVVPEMEKIEINHNELLKYVEKIEELQKAATANLGSYDSCRLSCLINCDCERYMDNYQQQIHLAETYMMSYTQLLNQQDELNTVKEGKYNEYKRYYDTYYQEYQGRQKKLGIENQEIKEKQNKISDKLRELDGKVHAMITNEMEKDIKSYYQKEYKELQNLDEIIAKGIGNPQLYYDLKEIQRTSEIMIRTLNPEIDVDKIVSKINSYENRDPDNHSDYARIKYISLQYSEILHNLKTVIAGYDSIPYFCMKAYPHYSDPIVDKNLEILDQRMNFSSESLEARTTKFLGISELDLSNSVFSLDLLFQGHPNIQKLNLSNTKISSIKHLTGSNIKWLDLSNTFITEEDLNYIRTMENLEYLNLSSTELKKKDIHDLCYYLKVKRRNCISR